MTMKLGMQHCVHEFYRVCSNDDPGLTLTYFTARSNLVFMLLYGKKVKQDFSRAFVVFDLKLAADDRSGIQFDIEILCPGLYTCIRYEKIV